MGPNEIAVGRMVYYVAYGTPGGEYPAGISRAAIITEVNKDNREIVGLTVFNPSGLFFNREVHYSKTPVPGTWHWYWEE